MYKPKYTITDRLLSTIKEITRFLTKIEDCNLDNQTLAKLEATAKTLSTYASTSIEGNPLPLTDVKRILKTSDTSIRDTEKEVLNYNKALNHIYTSIADKTFKLSPKTLEQTQGFVTKELMEHKKDEGKIRTEEVVIRDPQDPNRILFMPPYAKDIQEPLNNLISFINDNIEIIDPIILAGIFHREHVIIHPFMDGNGRTTRIITTALLGQTGINLFKIFSFENYYNQNVTKYFQKVGAFGDYYEIIDIIEHTEWLEYFTEGILDELIRVHNIIQNEQKVHQPRIEKHHQLILDYIKQHGRITQKEYSTITNRSLASRKKDFAYLINLNLISSNNAGKNTYYTLIL